MSTRLLQTGSGTYDPCKAQARGPLAGSRFETAEDSAKATLLSDLDQVSEFSRTSPLQYLQSDRTLIGEYIRGVAAGAKPRCTQRGRVRMTGLSPQAPQLHLQMSRYPSLLFEPGLMFLLTGSASCLSSLKTCSCRGKSRYSRSPSLNTVTGNLCLIAFLRLLQVTEVPAYI